MIEEGKLLEAIDQYYHDDVEVISDDETIRKGKKEVKEFDKNFLKEIEDVLGRGFETVTSDEKRAITIVEFWFKLKFKNGNRKLLKEVVVQYWKGEKIYKENFYSKK